MSDSWPPPPIWLRRVIMALGAYSAAMVVLVAAAVLYAPQSLPAHRAVIKMAVVLLLVWVVAGGWLQLRHRRSACLLLGARPGNWQVRFVLGCTLLAMMEEAITTALTNAAPLFGVRLGEAYITASANYLDVVAFHSVVVFVPQFAAWAVTLSRYDFHPSLVFLLYGIQGVINETLFGGPSNLLAGHWVFIYGLMVYLPAYCVPRDRGARPPHVMAYLLPFVLAMLFVMPVALLISAIHPVRIHFPPIR